MIVDDDPLILRVLIMHTVDLTDLASVTGDVVDTTARTHTQTLTFWSLTLTVALTHFETL